MLSSLSCRVALVVSCTTSIFSATERVDVSLSPGGGGGGSSATAARSRSARRTRADYHGRSGAPHTEESSFGRANDGLGTPPAPRFDRPAGGIPQAPPHPPAAPQKASSEDQIPPPRRKAPFDRTRTGPPWPLAPDFIDEGHLLRALAHTPPAGKWWPFVDAYKPVYQDIVDALGDHEERIFAGAEAISMGFAQLKAGHTASVFYEEDRAKRLNRKAIEAFPLCQSVDEVSASLLPMWFVVVELRARLLVAEVQRMVAGARFEDRSNLVRGMLAVLFGRLDDIGTSVEDPGKGGTMIVAQRFLRWLDELPTANNSSSLVDAGDSSARTSVVERVAALLNYLATQLNDLRDGVMDVKEEGSPAAGVIEKHDDHAILDALTNATQFAELVLPHFARAFSSVEQKILLELPEFARKLLQKLRHLRIIDDFRGRIVRQLFYTGIVDRSMRSTSFNIWLRRGYGHTMFLGMRFLKELEEHIVEELSYEQGVGLFQQLLKIVTAEPFDRRGIVIQSPRPDGTADHLPDLKFQDIRVHQLVKDTSKRDYANRWRIATENAERNAVLYAEDLEQPSGERLFFVSSEEFSSEIFNSLLDQYLWDMQTRRLWPGSGSELPGLWGSLADHMVDFGISPHLAPTVDSWFEGWAYWNAQACMSVASETTKEVMESLSFGLDLCRGHRHTDRDAWNPFDAACVPSDPLYRKYMTSDLREFGWENILVDESTARRPASFPSGAENDKKSRLAALLADCPSDTRPLLRSFARFLHDNRGFILRDALNNEAPILVHLASRTAVDEVPLWRYEHSIRVFAVAWLFRTAGRDFWHMLNEDTTSTSVGRLRWPPPQIADDLGRSLRRMRMHRQNATFSEKTVQHLLEEQEHNSSLSENGGEKVAKAVHLSAPEFMRDGYGLPVVYLEYCELPHVEQPSRDVECRLMLDEQRLRELRKERVLARYWRPLPVVDEEYFQLLSLLRALDERLTALREETWKTATGLLTGFLLDEARVGGLQRGLVGRTNWSELWRSAVGAAAGTKESANGVADVAGSDETLWNVAATLMTGLIAAVGRIFLPSNGVSLSSDRFSVAEWGAGPGIWAYRAGRLWHFWSKRVKFLCVLEAVVAQQQGIVATVVAAAREIVFGRTGPKKKTADEERSLARQLFRDFFEQGSSWGREESGAEKILRQVVLDPDIPENCHIVAVEPFDSRSLLRKAFDIEVWRYCRDVRLQDGVVLALAEQTSPGRSTTVRTLTEAETLPQLGPSSFDHLHMESSPEQEDAENFSLEEIPLKTFVPFHEFDISSGRSERYQNKSSMSDENFMFISDQRERSKVRKARRKTEMSVARIHRGNATVLYEWVLATVLQNAVVMDFGDLYQENYGSLTDILDLARRPEAGGRVLNLARRLEGVLEEYHKDFISQTTTSEGPHHHTTGRYHSITIDLVDLDIQGYEAEAVPAFLNIFGERVRRVHIGTHSRLIHARLRKAFLSAQKNGRAVWRLEQDVPTVSVGTIGSSGTVQSRDGFLSFRNKLV